MYENVVLLPNRTKDEELKYTKQAVAVLSSNRFKVRMDKSFETEIENAEFFDKSRLYDTADIILVLGGDGSILNAAQYSAKHKIPIIAVNLGRLGYIAQLEKTDIEKLPEILASNPEKDYRSMLSVSLTAGDGKKIIENKLVLNDAVICKSKGYGVIELETLCNDDPIVTYRGDGLIASTSTGSTAYSMSAGGSVIDSSLDLIEVVPICAHSLKSRPIIFGGSNIIKVRCLTNSGNVCISLDGARQYDMNFNDTVSIKIASEKASFLKVGNNGFCKILYNKMSDR